jgi:hypothetical protein
VEVRRSRHDPAHDVGRVDVVDVDVDVALDPEASHACHETRAGRSRTSARTHSRLTSAGRSAAVGEDGVVIRLVFLLRRKAGLSLAEFSDRWRLEHGPIVAGNQTSLGVLRYTQTHRLEDPMNEAMALARGGMEKPYDGLAELWWWSEEAFLETSHTGAGRRAGEVLLADEAEFIDLAASPLWLAHEYPQVNPTPETIVARPTSRVGKLHFPLRHCEGMSLDDAQRYWRVQHGPLIRSMAPAMGILRYQQVHRFETPFEAARRHHQKPPTRAGGRSRTSGGSSIWTARRSGSARSTSSSTGSDSVAR